MEKALAFYQKINGALLKAVFTFAAVVMGLDVLFIFAEAVGRYLLGESRAFMEEVPRLAIPFVVFPMMGVLLRLNKHIAVEVVPERLKGKPRALLMIVVHGVVLSTAIQLCIAGVGEVIYYYKMGFMIYSEFTFPVWLGRLPFPIGFGLLALVSLELILVELTKLIALAHGRPEPGQGGGEQ